MLDSRIERITLTCILLVFIAVSYPLSVYGAAAPWVGETLTGTPCSRHSGSGYGPYDYTQRARYAQNLKLVEGAHFNHRVESLTAGAKPTAKNPLPDLDYTLRAFPNHHRALNTAIRYAITDPKRFKSHKFSPVECYLIRAVHYSPKDATTHMLYGIYLHRTQHLEKALSYYEQASSLNPRDLQIQYNMGLLLVDLKRYEEAAEIAHTVYASDFPLIGLKKQLSAAGHWQPVTPQ